MSRFSVELEFPPPRRVTKTLGARLRQAQGAEVESIESLVDGGLVVRLVCDSDDALKAVDAACRWVRDQLAQASEAVATHRPRGVRATPFDEEDRFVELMGIAEIAALYGVSRQRASAMARTASFPRPVQQLSMGPVFSRAAVLRHQRRRRPH
jgi:hypothetical protein